MPIVNFKTLIKSLHYAYRGISHSYRNEQNFRIQLVIAGIVVAMMIIFRVSRNEAIILSLVISSVLILELINTAFEKITDIIKPRIHHYVQNIKDVMAAMVFLASLGALIIGLLIFIPRIFS